MESIRILIADDHTLFRSGLRVLFESLADMTVCGEAESGQEAINFADSLQPDVI
ncbi:MAG: DNA-binding response regulator, partial [Chloroflexi bacterium]